MIFFLYYFEGVVSGILINKFGLHVVVILSSVLVSSGFALSFIVTDIRYLYVTVSVLAGKKYIFDC